MKKVKVLLVLFFLALTPFSSNLVIAQTNQVPQSEEEDLTQKAIDDFGKESTLLDQKDSDELLKKVLEGVNKHDKLTTKSDITEETIVSYAAYDYSDNKILTINLGGSESNYHTFGVIFDGNEIISSNEIIINKIDDQSGSVKSYQDGVLTINQTFEYEKDKEPTMSTYAAAAKKKHKSWFSAFGYCMTNLSPVPAWVREGISVACAPLCTFGGAIGCTACVIAASGAYSVSAGYCVGYATHNS